MTARRRTSSSHASAPPSGARAALPWLALAGFAGLLGCASAPSKSSSPRDSAAVGQPEEMVRAGPTEKSPTDRDLAAEGRRRDDERGSDYRPLSDAEAGDPWKAEPGYPRVPQSPGTDETVPNESPRAVVIGDITLGTTPPGVTLPAQVRVAVASIRSGKLARRVPLLRQLSRALGTSSGVESVVALARLDAQAKDPADLGDLARAAAAQGAPLLLVEERASDSDEPTLALVVHAASATVLACARGAADKPPTADHGAGKLAALVRSAR